MMKLTAVAAVSENWALGSNNKLLWHLPEDFKFFKETTLNATVIMGRKTFESIGKVLPKRRNVVLTRDKNWKHPGVETYSSVSYLLESLHTDQEHFVIGGAEIYKLLLPLISEIFLTHVKAHFAEADVFFPKLDLENWSVNDICVQEIDERHSHGFIIKHYKRLE